MASVDSSLLEEVSCLPRLNLYDLVLDIAICRSLHVHPVQTGAAFMRARGLWAYNRGDRRLETYRF